MEQYPAFGSEKYFRRLERQAEQLRTKQEDRQKILHILNDIQQPNQRVNLERLDEVLKLAKDAGINLFEDPETSRAMAAVWNELIEKLKDFGIQAKLSREQADHDLKAAQSAASEIKKYAEDAKTARDKIESEIRRGGILEAYRMAQLYLEQLNRDGVEKQIVRLKNLNPDRNQETQWFFDLWGELEAEYAFLKDLQENEINELRNIKHQLDAGRELPDDQAHLLSQYALRSKNKSRLLDRWLALNANYERQRLSGGSRGEAFVKQFRDLVGMLMTQKPEDLAAELDKITNSLQNVPDLSPVDKLYYLEMLGVWTIRLRDWQMIKAWLDSLRELAAPPNKGKELDTWLYRVRERVERLDLFYRSVRSEVWTANYQGGTKPTLAEAASEFLTPIIDNLKRMSGVPEEWGRFAKHLLIRIQDLATNEKKYFDTYQIGSLSNNFQQIPVSLPLDQQTELTEKLPAPDVEPMGFPTGAEPAPDEADTVQSQAADEAHAPSDASESGTKDVVQEIRQEHDQDDVTSTTEIPTGSKIEQADQDKIPSFGWDSSTPQQDYKRVDALHEESVSVAENISVASQPLRKMKESADQVPSPSLLLSQGNSLSAKEESVWTSIPANDNEIRPLTVSVKQGTEFVPAEAILVKIEEGDGRLAKAGTNDWQQEINLSIPKGQETIYYRAGTRPGEVIIRVQSLSGDITPVTLEVCQEEIDKEGDNLKCFLLDDTYRPVEEIKILKKNEDNRFFVSFEPIPRDKLDVSLSVSESGANDKIEITKQETGFTIKQLYTLQGPIPDLKLIIHVTLDDNIQNETKKLAIPLSPICMEPDTKSHSRGQPHDNI